MTSISVASSIQDCVYRVCDICSALMRRNGTEWRLSSIGKVRNQVRSTVQRINSDIESGKLIHGMHAQLKCLTSNLIHLMALLMEVCVCVWM